MTSEMGSKEGAVDDSMYRVDIDTLAAALEKVATTRDPVVASTLVRVFIAVVTEASKSPRFANSLAQAIREPTRELPPHTKPKRANRRQPGPFDPFEVYRDGREEGLRVRLRDLELEQLRDVLAEHRMDNDRLAMKWKDRERVIERIVERVALRAEKGSAFS